MARDHILSLLCNIERKDLILAYLRLGQFKQRVVVVVTRRSQIIRVDLESFAVELLTDQVLIGGR